MSEIDSLRDRIDSQLATAARRAEDGRREALKEQSDREARVGRFDAAIDLFCTIWRPRLEVLQNRFTELIKVAPTIRPHAREATFSFASDRYSIELKFSAGPDADFRNLILEYDLRIIPALIKFDSHSRLVQPLDQIDARAVTGWLDDRILGFVDTFITLQGDSFFLDYLARRANV